MIRTCRERAERSGRSPGSVTLVAACKTQPPEKIAAAKAAGIEHFGENRVQEAEAKWNPGLRQGVTLHMIGRLQRNKVRRALVLFDVIQSVDSLALAERISRLATGVVPVLLEVNVGGEESKAGFPPQALREQLGPVLSLPNLEVRGLMTIAPLVDDPERARPYFRGLRELGEELRAELPSLGAELSMGMTDDYEVAIEEGATIVRVGRAIFGER